MSDWCPMRELYLGDCITPAVDIELECNGMVCMVRYGITILTNCDETIKKPQKSSNIITAHLTHHGKTAAYRSDEEGVDNLHVPHPINTIGNDRLFQFASLQREHHNIDKN